VVDVKKQAWRKGNKKEQRPLAITSKGGREGSSFCLRKTRGKMAAKEKGRPVNFENSHATLCRKDEGTLSRTVKDQEMRRKK